MKLLRLALALLVLVPATRAQEEQKKDAVVEAIVKEGKENTQVMTHLDYLCHKIGHRLTGSDNLTKACEWAVAQFKSFGIENARMEEWGTFPVGFNRGPWSGAMTSPESKTLTCATMSWTPGTNGAVEGPALAAPASAADVTEKYKGAWVLTSGRLAEDIMKKLDEVGAAGYVRGVRGELIVTDGNYRIKWENLPKRVQVYLIGSEYKQVSDLVKEGKDVRLKFDIKNEFVKGPMKLYNVLADIPGTEKPDEIVIVGGHIDSWDGAQGTVDNGTGTCTTIEAARLLMKAGAKPKRTIRFMLWSGEEQGLLGSSAWIQKHKAELKNISCVLVHDGGTNYVSGIAATTGMVPIFEKVFASVLNLNEKMPFKIRKVERLPYPIGSDHDAFLGAGVPGFFWNQSGRANYTYAHHTQHDKFDQAIPEYQQHTSIVVAVGAWGLANIDGLLPREGLPTGRSSGMGGRRLGINLEDDGVTISSISDDYPAAKAGCREGDKILELGGTKITLENLRSTIQKCPKSTTIKVLRDGKELEFKVEFPE